MQQPHGIEPPIDMVHYVLNFSPAIALIKSALQDYIGSAVNTIDGNELVTCAIYYECLDAQSKRHTDDTADYILSEFGLDPVVHDRIIDQFNWRVSTILRANIGVINPDHIYDVIELANDDYRIVDKGDWRISQYYKLLAEKREWIAEASQKEEWGNPHA